MHALVALDCRDKPGNDDVGCGNDEVGCGNDEVGCANDEVGDGNDGWALAVWHTAANRWLPFVRACLSIAI
ncbi:MAG TPA: hypothetical protein ENK15_01950 [Thermopetrobacter sp.]|nr:hypothetical protein [Thermopetrobacter sp.]